MAAPQLTPGAVAVISQHADGEGTLKPVLQVMDVRQVTNSKSPAAAERYRMLLSDGVHTLQSMLATAENYRIREGHIVKGSIVHLQEFTCSTIQSRRIIIIIKLDILQSECPIIGSPVPYGSNNQTREQRPNVPTTSAQTYSGPNTSGPGASETSVAARPGQVANNSQPDGGGSYTGFQGTVAAPVDRTAQPVPNVSYGGSYGTMPARTGSQGTAAAPVDQTVQPVPNVPYSGSYGTASAHTGLQGTGATPVNRTVEPVANVSYGSSYGTMSAHTGFQGAVATPVNHAVEPVPNVSYGGSYGTMSAHNAMNANMMQSRSQQAAMSTHQNQRFAVPATAGSIGPPGNTYGRPTQPLYQQAAPMHINRGPASKNDATNQIIPVAKLNPYQSKWTIKVRVTAKSEIKSYTNAKGPGKVFSFDVLDAHGGEIRATAFNAQLDQFYDQIEVGKVYLISRGNLKPAGRKFNYLSHEFEITLDPHTSIQICHDDNSIPRQQFNFRLISELENMEENTPVDLVGVVTSVNPPGSVILKKDGSERRKRTLELRDMSGRSVGVTFWGKFCDVEGHQLQADCDSGLNPILAMKNAMVSYFNGRSLNTGGSTQLEINPDFPEAEKLRHWYETEGRTADCVSLSRGNSSMNDVRKTVAQIKDEDLGRSGKPDFIIIKGSISHVYVDNFYYPACPAQFSDGRKCQKKVTNNGDGTWYCERCEKASPSCEFRYMMNFQIQDHTGVQYATAFQDAAVEIIQYDAQELATAKEEDDARFAEIIQGIRFHLHLFKLKVYEETYNDEQRIKCQIMRAVKLDPLKESGYLLGAIDSLLKEDAVTHPEVQAATTYGAGFSNSGQSLPTSSNAYTVNTSGSMHGDSLNQFGQQINNTHAGGLSTPVSAARNVQSCLACGSSGHNAQNCPSAMYRQQPAARPASSYGSTPGDAGRNAANMFPADGAVAQPQPYRNDSTTGGYNNRQPYVGATNYY